MDSSALSGCQFSQNCEQIHIVEIFYQMINKVVIILWVQKLFRGIVGQGETNRGERENTKLHFPGKLGLKYWQMALPWTLHSNLAQDSLQISIGIHYRYSGSVKSHLLQPIADLLGP